jgi:hypothetical protein
MPRQSHTLPPLALSAFRLLHGQFQQQLDALGKQAVDVMGLQDSDGWTVDFGTGIVFREIPDEADGPKAVP